MIWIWFGLDGTGIGEAPDFHWFLGPVLMVMFAFLGNTLFLTILVSMLSNTFSNIVVNAVQEVQFRRAVLTFEGVKSDAIFSYHRSTLLVLSSPDTFIICTTGRSRLLVIETWPVSLQPSGKEDANSTGEMLRTRNLCWGLTFFVMQKRSLMSGPWETQRAQSRPPSNLSEAIKVWKLVPRSWAHGHRRSLPRRRTMLDLYCIVNVHSLFQLIKQSDIDGS